MAAVCDHFCRIATRLVRTGSPCLPPADTERIKSLGRSRRDASFGDVRLAAPVVIALLVVGCADEPGGKGAQAPAREPDGDNSTQRTVEPVRCPPSADNCASAAGRVVFLEAVDPDGDGDLHVVLAGEQGITVVDIAPRLRPRRLPRMGDVVAAAGPVYRGSYGQRQIQAAQVRYEHGR